MKGQRINWKPRELAWIKRRRKMERSKLHVAFVKKFRRHDISLLALCSLCKRSGWLVGPHVGRGKGHSIAYSAAEIAFIRRRKTLPRRQLHTAFVEAFGRTDVAVESIKQLCLRRGWKTGRDGRLVKGNTPPNKGKKMPFNANSARTRFQKGSRHGMAARKYKPIGSERTSKDGYRERKIHDGLPMQSRWRLVHLVKWEAINGPIPKGMALKCKSDRSNTDPSNWDLVPRALLPRLNGKSGRRYDQAPAELKPAIMAIAKLEHGIREKQRRA